MNNHVQMLFLLLVYFPHNFRSPGIFYLNVPDHTLREELFFFCSDNLQLFPISNVQILPSKKFSQIHKLSGKTKHKETWDLGRERNEG